MELQVQSLRTFIGSSDYALSRAFYSELGFREHAVSEKMSIFQRDGHVFFLQDYYVKDWLENTMLLIEVNDAALWFRHLTELGIAQKYTGVKLLPLAQEDWADVCRVIGPAGELLHLPNSETGSFYIMGSAYDT